MGGIFQVTVFKCVCVCLCMCVHVHARICVFVCLCMLIYVYILSAGSDFTVVLIVVLRIFWGLFFGRSNINLCL